jgi:hypothetical protein
MCGVMSCMLFSVCARAQVPPLKLFVMADDNVEQQRYCFRELYLGNTTQPVAQQNSTWYKFQVCCAQQGRCLHVML